MDSEDMLFIFYISGIIGIFKGVVYIMGGYNFYIYVINKWVFDL